MGPANELDLEYNIRNQLNTGVTKDYLAVRQRTSNLRRELGMRQRVPGPETGVVTAPA